jgi:hypothetical protein
LIMFRYDAYPISASEKSLMTDRSGKLRMVNKRAEMLWRMREVLDPDHGLPICLPPGRMVKADLCAARWHLTAGGILIEDKDDIRSRIGRSPDVGDALCLALIEHTDISSQFAVGPEHTRYTTR